MLRPNYRRHTISNLPFEAGMSLGDVELNTLNALIAISRGSTYVVWKSSGLKHYPTVLRSLKKLQKKGLVTVSDVRGERGERFYAPTLLGRLVAVHFRQDKKELVALMAEKSASFKELLNGKIEDDTIYDWTTRGILELTKDPRKDDPGSLNRALENAVEDTISEYTTEILNCRESEKELSEILNMLKRLSAVRWVNNLIISYLNDWLDRSKKDQQNFERFMHELGN